MALKVRLSPRITQKIGLTPALRQSLALLQMPLPALHDEVLRQADGNPLLLVDEPPILRQNLPRNAALNLAAPETLAENLCRQLAEMPLSSDIAALAGFLAGDLNEDGYLETSTADLSAALDVAPARIEAAIAALQSCEPVGIGARNLAECLALQLVDRGHDPADADIACANLHLLSEGDWAAAARATGWPRDRLKALTAEIGRLSPRPAAGIARVDHGPAPGELAVPELLVERDALDRLVVSLHRDARLRVRIDPTLAASMPDTPQRAEADALLAALTFRGQTLLRVATALIGHQTRHFIAPGRPLRPLTRAALAEIVGLHATTVGRVIAGKYLEFDGSCLPLSRLLSPALGTTDGASISAHDVQCRIRHLIDDEPSDRPLSDARIAALLSRAGVDIARRTVAKYRECMTIPPSHKRRRKIDAQEGRATVRTGVNYRNI